MIHPKQRDKIVRALFDLVDAIEEPIEYGKEITGCCCECEYNTLKEVLNAGALDYYECARCHTEQA